MRDDLFEQFPVAANPETPAPSSDPPDAKRPINLTVVPISEIEVSALAERVADGALVIDVREVDEYAPATCPARC